MLVDGAYRLALIGVNTAVSEWVPVDKVVVAADVAAPPLTVTGVPSVAAPSMNCTEPAAEDGKIVAVNVTDVPAVVGLGALVVNVVVVAVGPAPAAFTT